MEMVNASTDVSVKIHLDKVPFLDGAIDCVKNKIFSSLQPQNIRLRRAIDTNSQRTASKFPQYSLLFDPQTAGGLLCGVPAAKVSSCLKELRKLGYNSSAVIGEVISNESVEAGGAILIDCEGMYNSEKPEARMFPSDSGNEQNRCLVMNRANPHVRWRENSKN